MEIKSIAIPLAIIEKYCNKYCKINPNIHCLKEFDTVYVKQIMICLQTLVFQIWANGMV